MKNDLTMVQKGGTIYINRGSGLDRKEYHELANLLRKNMLYQTPKPVFGDNEGDDPVWVDMRFVYRQQQRILELIIKHGGWTLPPDAKKKVLECHDKQAREAYGDGVDYDFSGLSYGELQQMFKELEGVEELIGFRKAIGEVLYSFDENRAASGKEGFDA